MFAGRPLHHGVMHVWVERCVQRLDPHTVVPAEHLVDLLPHDLETVQQRGGVGMVFGGLDRPVHVVQHGQQVSQ